MTGVTVLQIGVQCREMQEEEQEKMKDWTHLVTRGVKKC
jgi:hypothetical protein